MASIPGWEVFGCAFDKESMRDNRELKAIKEPSQYARALFTFRSVDYRMVNFLIVVSLAVEILIK